MEIIIPKFKRGEKVAGVYKMTFDEKHFYIGGSKNLRSRISYWKFKILQGAPKNRNIKNIIQTCNIVVIEILQVIKDVNAVKQEEDKMIKQYFGLQYCLNRAPSAFDNTGLKFLPGEIKRRAPAIIKQRLYSKEEKEAARKFAIASGSGQKVAKFSLNGDYIETFDCVSMAAESIGDSRDSIRRMFNGRRKSARGFIFKRVDNVGNIIENKKIPRKKMAPGSGRKMTEAEKQQARDKTLERFNANPGIFMKGEPARKVDLFNKEGTYIKSFPSINQASKHLSIHSSNICKVLKGKRKETNGFIFKYAL